MNVFRYLKQLGETDSGQSSKAFAVVVSTIISGLMGLTLCGVIAYDVYVDGKVDSDMQDMGILMLCMGGFVGGSSVSKIFGDQAEERGRRYRKPHGIHGEEEYDDNITEKEDEP